MSYFGAPKNRPPIKGMVSIRAMQITGNTQQFLVFSAGLNVIVFTTDKHSHTHNAHCNCQYPAENPPHTHTHSYSHTMAHQLNITQQ